MQLAHLFGNPLPVGSIVTIKNSNKNDIPFDSMFQFALFAYRKKDLIEIFVYFFRSSDFNLKHGKCSVILKGNSADVILVKLKTYKLR